LGITGTGAVTPSGGCFVPPYITVIRIQMVQQAVKITVFFVISLHKECDG
jgi:hypothetical protein